MDSVFDLKSALLYAKLVELSICSELSSVCYLLSVSVVGLIRGGHTERKSENKGFSHFTKQFEVLVCVFSGSYLKLVRHTALQCHS